jgi:ribosome-associated protein
MLKKEKYLRDIDLAQEVIVTASRSSGPGGQNVNKVNTKIELRFNIDDSTLLSDSEKSLLIAILKPHLTNRNELIIVSQTERSQLKNKGKAIDKFYFLIGRALTPRAKRIPTRPTASSRARRLDSKRKKSQNKYLRREGINHDKHLSD